MHGPLRGSRLAAMRCRGKMVAIAAPDRYDGTMLFPVLLMAVAAAPVPARSNSEGRLGTLPTGRYLCELPGDANGLASRPIAGAWFDIVNASTYSAEGGGGTYLVTGDRVAFTRGPMKSARFIRHGERVLRRLDLSGELGKMRCIRTGRGKSRASAGSAADRG